MRILYCVLPVLLLRMLLAGAAKSGNAPGDKQEKPRQRQWKTDTVHFGAAFPQGIDNRKFVFSKLLVSDGTISYLDGSSHKLYTFPLRDTGRAWHLIVVPDTVRYYAYRLRYPGQNADSLYHRFNLIARTLVFDFRVSGNRLRMLYSNSDELLYRDFIYDLDARRVLCDEAVATGGFSVSVKDMVLRFDTYNRFVGGSDACKCLITFTE